MKLVIAPASRLVQVLEAHRPSAAVSLVSPDAPEPDLPLAARDRLVLRFNDITTPREGLKAPSEDEIAALFGFIDSRAPQEMVLIHCYAGISRSPAAALILAARSRPGEEAVLAARLRALSSTCTPNLLMVEIADRMLCRAGALRDACAAMGRGAEAFEGEPFLFP